MYLHISVYVGVTEHYFNPWKEYFMEIKGITK